MRCPETYPPLGALVARPRAVDAAIEREILAPLRRTRRSHVPTTLLTREQAWNLAHTSDFAPSTNDEMVDPWDYELQADEPARRQPRTALSEWTARHPCIGTPGGAQHC